MGGIRISFLFVFLCFLSCSEPTDQENHINPPHLNPENFNVAFLVMDGVFNTELTAPYDVFHHTIFRTGIKAMNVFTVAENPGPIQTFEGINLQPDFYFKSTELPKIDILVVPSAEHHLDSDLENKCMIEWVKRIGLEAEYVLSHCDGAFVLAEAGLLEGLESTTFPGDIEIFRNRYPQLTIHDSLVFVHDGKFISSAGGAKSFDASLYLIQLLYGKIVADEIAEGLVIDWNLESVPHIIVKK